MLAIHYYFVLVEFYVTPTLYRLYGDFPALLMEEDLRSHYALFRAPV